MTSIIQKVNNMMSVIIVLIFIAIMCKVYQQCFLLFNLHSMHQLEHTKIIWYRLRYPNRAIRVRLIVPQTHPPTPQDLSKIFFSKLASKKLDDFQQSLLMSQGNCSIRVYRSRCLCSCFTVTITQSPKTAGGIFRKIRASTMCLTGAPSLVIEIQHW